MTFAPSVRACLCLLLTAISFSCSGRPLDLAPTRRSANWQTFRQGWPGRFIELESGPAGRIYGLQTGAEVKAWDGSAWTSVGQAEFLPPEDMWVAPSGEILVATPDRIRRWDGIGWGDWYVHASNSIRCIWGSSANDIFVGTSQEILHYDGSAWTNYTLPLGRQALVLWGSAPNDVFAAGTEGYLLHFNGVEWQEVNSGTSDRLLSFWGTGPNDVFATTYSDVLHYDGVSWESLPLPEEMRDLGEIWGAASDDVYVLYDAGGIARYDGVTWQPMNSNTGAHLYGIRGDQSGGVLAAGDYNKTVRFDGSVWSSLEGGGARNYDVLFAIDPAHVYVGDTDVLTKFDGTNFTEMPSVVDNLGTLALWGDAPDFLVSVGAPDRIFHFDGTRWLQQAAPAPIAMVGLHGTSRQRIFAVGDDETVISFNGTQWDIIHSGNGGRFVSVWASEKYVFVAEERGRIGRFDGQEWQFDTLPENSWTTALWGVDDTQVYAATYSGLYEFDGASWDRVNHPRYFPAIRFESFSAVAGYGERVYAGSGIGTLFELDGSIWFPVENPEEIGLSSMFALATGEVYVWRHRGSSFHSFRSETP